MSGLLIKGGRVIDPASGHDALADIVVRSGRIEAISSSPVSSSDLDVIDAQGCLVTPGLIDIHVHFREPSTTHRETIATGSAAAAAGGFTSVCCMPNTTPAIDTVELVEFVTDRGDAAGKVRVFPTACGTLARRGKTLAPIQELIDAGAVAITDDGDGIADPEMMSRILSEVAQAGSCFMQHCQDPDMTRGSVMNAGVLAQQLGLIGWPAIAEAMMLERDIAINESIGARYHAQHVTCRECVDLIRGARQRNEPVSGEASPHHLLLTEEACRGWNTNAKMNPPLRQQRDIDALKEGIADGTITILATDHAPHPPETKATDFTSASFGVVGVEAAIPLYATALIADGVIDWMQMVAMMTTHPAALVGLDQRGLGSLTASGPADITIINPDATWTIDPEKSAGTGRNTPFAGRNVTGRIEATIVAGRVVFGPATRARSLV
jgi:dihydroorotase